VRKSADGHFYVSGFLNGFPTVFLVDTGASKTAVGISIARNAGIRAGLTSQAQTANGLSSVASSSGNQINVGPFGFASADVIVTVNQSLPNMALLGMDILKQFQLHQTQDTLMLKKLD
jgi:aspartyl protease family protein